jgi:ribosome-associated toxin RatA of RatAB toxin-antitoxin module
MPTNDPSSSDQPVRSERVDHTRNSLERAHGARWHCGERVGAILAGMLAVVVAAADVPNAIAATVTVTTDRRDDAIDIRASALLKADATTAWRVLTDYGRYTDFIPDLRVSRVISRKDEQVVVEQSGDAALWVFKLPLDITFEVSEFPPSRLQSHATAGSLPILDSSYALTPAGSALRLEYAGRVNTGYRWFGNFEQTAVEKNIARQFKALADEIERQDAASHSKAIAEVR